MIETGHDVRTLKYSPQADKFASSGEDNIHVWSKDGKLLIEIKGLLGDVVVLVQGWCVSGSRDYTDRKWQMVKNFHTKAVTSIRVSPNESHLVSASADYSVCIWNLRTNRRVGSPPLARQ
jgi:WD40 repeat protein